MTICFLAPLTTDQRSGGLFLLEGQTAAIWFAVGLHFHKTYMLVQLSEGVILRVSMYDCSWCEVDGLAVLV